MSVQSLVQEDTNSSDDCDEEEDQTSNDGANLPCVLFLSFSFSPRTVCFQMSVQSLHNLQEDINSSDNDHGDEEEDQTSNDGANLPCVLFLSY